MARIAVPILGVLLISGCSLTRSDRLLADRVIPCPCEVEQLGQLPQQHPLAVIRCDSTRATARYHPGAFVTYRVFDPETDPVAGNQCAYDSEGRLITAGPAAGTPDRISPERSVLGHWLLDVRPFHRLGWLEYHRRGWAPISRVPGS